MRKVLKAALESLPFKPHVFSAMGRVVKLPEPIYSHLYFKNTPFRVRIDARHSFSMYHCGGKMENELFWQGLCASEGPSYEVWRRLVPLSTSIFDCGGLHGRLQLNCKVYEFCCFYSCVRATEAKLQPADLK